MIRLGLKNQETQAPTARQPFRRASCVKIHDDDSGYHAIHDQVGHCCEDILIPTHLAGQSRHHEVADQSLNGPDAGPQT